MFTDSKSGIQTAVNAFLVNTGTHLVLVDAGTSQCFGPTLGAIKNNLRAAGYQPEQIDMILLTHLHPDHACGITDQGKAAFPNATVYASKADGDYWLSKEMASKAPKDAQPMFKMAQDAVAPYAEQGKLKLYSPGEQLLPGLEVIATPGHTPGHASYLFSSGGQKLLLWGISSTATLCSLPNLKSQWTLTRTPNRRSLPGRRCLPMRLKTSCGLAERTYLSLAWATCASKVKAMRGCRLNMLQWKSARRNLNAD